MPQKQILRELKYSSLNINLMAPYFDFSDLENPVKYHLDDQKYLFFDESYTHIMDLTVRK